MKPIEFEEQNAVYGANQEGVQPLPALKTDDGRVISCWELTDEDFERIVESRKIYVAVQTFHQSLQPLYVTTDLNDV